jgi:hypothetical protein
MPTIRASIAATIAPECVMKKAVTKCKALDRRTAACAAIQNANIALPCSRLLFTIFVSTLAPHTILPLPKAGRYNILGYDLCDTFTHLTPGCVESEAIPYELFVITVIIDIADEL